MPKINHPSKVRLNVYMTAFEKDGLEATAARHMLNASQWVRTLIIKYGIDSNIPIEHKTHFTTVTTPIFTEVDPSELGIDNTPAPKRDPDAALLGADAMKWLEEDSDESE